MLSLQSSPARDLNRNFAFTYFDAIDNQNVFSNIKFDHEKFKEKYKRTASVGEVGCALSHTEILKKFSKDENEWLCVLEDDALTEDKFIDFISLVSKESFDVPIMIVIGYSKTKKINNYIHKLKFPILNPFYIGNYEVGESYGNLYGTVGYVVNKLAAEKFENIHKIYWVADDWVMLSNLGIKILHISTPLIYEDLSTSSSTGNVVHCVDDIFAHPVGNLLYIMKVQMKVLRMNIACMLRNLMKK